MKLHLIIVALLCSMVTAVPAAYAKTLQDVVLLAPRTSASFWQLVAKAMRAACDDLGCTLTVYDAQDDRYKMVEQAKAIARQETKPDVVIFQSYKFNGPEIIKALDAGGVNGFLFNAGLTSEQKVVLGKPRENYPHWIGEMMPDDVGAGYETLRLLYEQAKQRGLQRGGVISMFGIEGNHSEGGSIERKKGMKAFLRSVDDLKLSQIVQGKWSYEESAKMTRRLMMRYPDTLLIWAASDTMALGAADMAKELGRMPGKDILISGTDWDEAVLDSLKSGEISASAGGHFMEGAWVVVAMYDYLNGIDFESTEGLQMRSPMMMLTGDNLSLYRRELGDEQLDNIDFTQFTKTHNKQLKRYDFNILKLLK